MSQTEAEIQLKVWKDLAISKQVLMGAATKALGLNAECSTEDLRTALDQFVKRAEAADSKVASMREETDKELADMKAQLKSSEEAKTEALTQLTDAIAARETAERQLAAGRADNAKAIKDAKADVAENQNKLKAISKALADTPENVVKKLKVLKKQKLDDAKTLAQVEARLLEARKEKGKIEQEAEAQKAKLELATPLVTNLREMHDLCCEANKKIKSLSEDENDLLDIPSLDEEVLKGLEDKPAEEEETSEA